MRIARWIIGVALPIALLLNFLTLDLMDRPCDFIVAQRLASGARLYADVYIYTSPLSLYADALLLKVFPVSVATTALWTLFSCLLLSALMTWVVFRQTHGNRRLSAAYLVATLYLGVYHAPAWSYSWQAVLLSACAVALLTGAEGWGDAGRETAGRWALIGLALGSAVAAKQTIGLVVSAAFFGWTIHREAWSPRPSLGRWLRRALPFTAGAGAAAGTVALTMIYRGEWRAFVRIMSGLGSNYYAPLSFPYRENFGLPALPSQIPNWLLEQTTAAAILAGAAGSALLLLISFWPRRDRLAERSRDPRCSFWAFLYLGTFASLFPRADYAHAAFGMPFFFASIAALSWRLAEARARSRLLGAAKIAVIAMTPVIAAMAARGAWRMARGELVFFPGYPGRGMLVSAGSLSDLEKLKTGIADLGPGDRLLVADRSAHFLYPYLGLPNPTRHYDFIDGLVPKDELAGVRQDIEAGRFGAVILNPRRSPSIAEAAKRSMILRGTAGEFEVFVAKPAAR